MSENSSRGLDLIQACLASGDIDGIRKAILELGPEDRRLLRDDLGEPGFQRVKDSAGARRGAKNGHVIVLHGITGSMLESVDRGGDADRIWVNPVTLARGRILELKLKTDGSPVDAAFQIRTRGMHRRTYLPMILELDRAWHVHPFEYDWRSNIDVSADRLDERIRDIRRNDESVHLVAHSMGGLVCRRFIQRHPDTWDAMSDVDASSSAGRLIMLGTPNFGAFSIVQALTGQEKLLKILACLDFKHDMKELLEILNTFPGSYQMLPSPLVDLDDDHEELFNREAWGDHPIIDQHLADAKRFHAEMNNVVDQERFIYIAGYNRRTPVKIRVDDGKPGEFEFQMSPDGDGRVPHALGRLPHVPTFWIEESHGDLPRNETVLSAIGELLASGRTSRLVQDKPTLRVAEGEKEWVAAEEVFPIPADIAAAMKKFGQGAKRGVSDELSPSEQLDIESELADGYLASAHRSDPGSAAGRSKKTRRRDSRRAGVPAAPRIAMEVVWGDITQADGNFYVVGHYEDILPQNAERALDLAVSGLLGTSRNDLKKEEFLRRQVIREHSRRGSIRSNVGDITYFPWFKPEGQQCQVAVAGMGRPGAFGVTSLVRLYRDAFLAMDLLPGEKSICTVLIGAGEGSLRPEESVSGLVEGLAEACRSRGRLTTIESIKVVEIARNKAENILEALRQAAAQPEIVQLVDLNVKKRLTTGPGGRIPTPDALEMLLDAASRAVSQTEDPAQQHAVDTVLGNLTRKDAREAGLRALKAFRESRTGHPDRQLTNYVVTEKHVGPVGGRRTRISCYEEGGVIRVAAITNTTTIAEREIGSRLDLVRDIVNQINDPDLEPEENLPSFLTRLFFPRDFREILSGAGEFVFGVDRTTAQIHWEMLAPNLKTNDAPLGVSSCVARQLRTQYSAAPNAESGRYEHGKLKALVIGDPGSVKQGQNLPGAREEALKVCKILSDNGVDVTALIGAADGPRDKIPKDVQPATRLTALHHMMHGYYDLLHYSGHGDFDPDAPDQVGWVFERGLLTAREIRGIDNVAGLIFANACLSSRTSEALSAGRRVSGAGSEAGLLPSLADEFFRLGASNYIGTSWEVNDIGAVQFAEVFYNHLLRQKRDEDRPNVGEAMLEARKKLYKNRAMYGKLWAAYQHYGDPASRIRRA